MTLNNPTNQREGFTPEGCIATVPPQSARSHELVIEALARELALANDLLGSVIDVYVHRWSVPEEVRQECVYTQGCRRAQDFLEDLRENWPHLDV